MGFDRTLGERERINVQYIGSKRQLLGFIDSVVQDVIGEYRGAVVGDLFAGTGAVGSYFKEKDCRVIANDLQYYSYVINKYLIENSDLLDMGYLSYFNSLVGHEGLVYQNYCKGSGSKRMYFSDRNGKHCDAIRVELERMKVSKEIDENTYYGYLAGLIYSINKYSNTTGVYGSYLKNLKPEAKKWFQIELMSPILGEQGVVYNEDCNTLIERINGDILYLDPPYNERQYFSNYHVLEMIARYDKKYIGENTTGVGNILELKSKYCSKSYVYACMEQLISDAKFPYIFISYSSDGLLTNDDFYQLGKKYICYERFEQGYRKYNSGTHNEKNVKEYIHFIRK